ncbi:hypothetical protein N1851_008057 [Merluccius polli]|uniref:Uncharacterized protein n=1 Tax=Merluccius polli TaxID=89951 RepID=A0AA47N1S6_MERPO|nr:hypothetical protein N1851_008057 [Merluccius polli]
MSGIHPIGFLVLLLTLPPSESTIQKLNSIKDLKTIPFGESVPMHSLVLLHWFANNIELNNNDVIELTFDPADGDYGTHHYGNYERVLDPLPRGQGTYRYYTLGNLYQTNNNQIDLLSLPLYVTDHLDQIAYEELNRDRIIFRLHNRNGVDTIDRVYITQHYESNQQRGTMYDPEHTYQITTNLLRELRVFTLERSGRSVLLEIRNHFRSSIDNNEIRSLRNTWGELACLGLLLFIVINEKNVPRRPDRPPASRPPQNHQPKQNRPSRATHHTVVNIPEYNPSHNRYTSPYVVNNTLRSSASNSHAQNENCLQVRAGKKGKAKVYWTGIPQHILQEGVMVVLFKNDEDTTSILHKYTKEPWGDFETSVALNKGLQVRLHKAIRFCLFFTRMGEEIMRGFEYHNVDAEMPVSIAGSDAMLNVFVKDGTACARLYIPVMFTDWKNDFRKSWVGFYTSEMKQTNQYETWQWQWATKFVEEGPSNSYNVYEYHSSVAVAPGVHARFIDRHGNETARTPAWS